MSARGAILTAKVNNLQMQIVPALFGKEALTVALRLLHALAVGQPPAIDKAMDVRINGEGRLAETLGHDDLSRFMSYAG